MIEKQAARHDLAREKARQNHLKVTGEVVWEWNALHRSFCYVFIFLLGRNQMQLGNALWHTPSSDKAQRELLKSAVEWADGISAPHRERLIWAIEQADRLSTYRNDIVHGHAGFLIDEKGLTTTLSSGRNSFKRLVKHMKIDTPFHELMGALCDDLRRLDHFVTEIWRGMEPQDGKTKRSPRRPQMKSLALVDAGHKRTHVPRARTKKKSSGERPKAPKK
jgi:hypothetical protein